MRKNQHVVPHNGAWAVRGARNIAINQHSEVVIHRPNGKIRDKNSYGNDSFPPRG